MTGPAIVTKKTGGNMYTKECAFHHTYTRRDCQTDIARELFLPVHIYIFLHALLSLIFRIETQIETSTYPCHLTMLIVVLCGQHFE